MKNIFSVLFTAIISLSLMSYFNVESDITSFVVVTSSLVVASFLVPKGVLTISAAAARDPFTNLVIAKYSEDISVGSFFRSFFTPKYSNTKKLSIAVRRSGEQMAVDVLRGTGSKLTSKTKSSLKTFTPPYFAYSHNVNELDLYDTAWASLDPTLLGEVAAESAEMLIENRKLIERRYEYQCMEVLTSGIVTMVNGDNIDYKRKTASMPSTTAGEYWSVSTVDPMTIIEDGGKFIREQGKAKGGIYNVIIGEDAWNAMVSNPIFQAKYEVRNYMIGSISMPVMDGTGATTRGYVAGASYTYNFITYPEVYEDENGDIQKYMPTNQIIVLPTQTNFVMGYAQVPMLRNIASGVPMVRKIGAGDFWFKEYIDPKNDNHVQEIRSAGVPIPVAVDQIYSRKVVA